MDRSAFISAFDTRVDDALFGLGDHAAFIFDFCRMILEGFYDAILKMLTLPPFYVVAALAGAVAWRVLGRTGGIATALALVNDVLAANERVLKTPAPVVGVARLTDACVSININPWVNVPDYEAAISEVNQAVLAAFREHGIVIPLPQREVRMV